MAAQRGPLGPAFQASINYVTGSRRPAPAGLGRACLTLAGNALGFVEAGVHEFQQNGAQRLHGAAAMADLVFFVF